MEISKELIKVCEELGGTIGTYEMMLEARKKLRREEEMLKLEEESRRRKNIEKEKPKSFRGHSYG